MLVISFVAILLQIPALALVDRGVMSGAHNIVQVQADLGVSHGRAVGAWRYSSSAPPATLVAV
jgi:hypothetical protein